MGKLRFNNKSEILLPNGEKLDGVMPGWTVTQDPYNTYAEIKVYLDDGEVSIPEPKVNNGYSFLGVLDEMLWKRSQRCYKDMILGLHGNDFISAEDMASIDRDAIRFANSFDSSPMYRKINAQMVADRAEKDAEECRIAFRRAYGEVSVRDDLRAGFVASTKFNSKADQN